MSKPGKMLKFACGCMVLVTTGASYLFADHGACEVVERLCEMKALPPDNPHGPENDHRPGNAPARMTIEVETSASDTGFSSPGFRLSDFPKVTDT
jgi:hypothetical protein